MFTVTDLKQMGYCPRIPFYQYCLPGVHVAATGKMVLGAQANDATELLEHRRSLRAYGLKAGEREFDVAVQGEIVLPAPLPPIALSGRVDMLIRTPEGELIPVDYKNSWSAGAPQHNWQLQVATYALLLEAERGVTIQRGFLYFIPRKRAMPVIISLELRHEVQELLHMLREMVDQERMPPPTPVRKRCAACEYRLLCNDV